MAGTRVLEQLVALTVASRRTGHALPFTLRAAVRDPTSAVFPEGMAGVESKRLDMLDAATYGEALEHVERVFVLFHPMFSKAIPGFLDACREAHVRHVVMMTVRRGCTASQARSVQAAAALLEAVRARALREKLTR